MDELVVLVNDKNEQVGVMPKVEAHNAHTPLHRAFSVYVFNKEGKFLLTQRALKKKVFPGVWTNSCCGHPGPGEKTETAIKRRLKDELGLKPKTLQLVLPDFRYRAKMHGVVENEICPVYVATVSSAVKPNPDEVENFEWVSWKEFQNRLKKHPRKYSKWCREQAEELRRNLFFKATLRKEETLK
jgi:isopentenyl-diphosphate Delta-isomerase